MIGTATKAETVLLFISVAIKCTLASLSAFQHCVNFGINTELIFVTALFRLKLNTYNIMKQKYDPIKAKQALIDGVWDDPDLFAYGFLHVNREIDIRKLDEEILIASYHAPDHDYPERIDQKSDTKNNRP